MSTDDVVRCAFGLCRCKIDVEDGFCSAACASGTSGAEVCGCGHEECAEGAVTADAAKADAAKAAKA